MCLCLPTCVRVYACVCMCVCMRQMKKINVLTGVAKVEVIEPWGGGEGGGGGTEEALGAIKGVLGWC